MKNDTDSACYPLKSCLWWSEHIMPITNNAEGGSMDQLVMMRAGLTTMYGHHQNGSNKKHIYIYIEYTCTTDSGNRIIDNLIHIR